MKEKIKIKMKKLQKFKKLKFHIAPKYKGVILEQEVEEVFDETARRLGWKYGKNWEKSCSKKEFIEIFVSKSEEVAKEYLNRKTREKVINKLTEGLMRLRNEQLFNKK